MTTIRHIAGPYEGLLQYCVICGKTLTDHRGAMVPRGSGSLQGWAEGEVFVRGNMTSIKSPTHNFEDCKP